MIVFFISIVSIILALMHLVIYKAIILVFPMSAFLRYLAGSALFLFCMSFVLASVLVFNSDNSLIRIYYTVAATWLGFAFYLFLASCVIALLYFLAFLLRFDPHLVEFTGILFFLAAFVVSLYGVLHANNILIKQIDVPVLNLPIAWKNRKIAWVSDVHLGAVHGKDFMTRVVHKLQTINPDMLFIGGDLYDGVKVNETEIIQPLSRINPPLGVFFVTGNHEEFHDPVKYSKAIKSIGIRVLNNEIVDIGGLQIIGVDDRDSIDISKFKQILSGLHINTSKPAVLLKHEPSGLESAEAAGITLQISGHTHRAQVFPLNLITSLIFKGYDYGLRKFGSMYVYTSSGVGTWGPPLRVGSDSEIVVFKFTDSGSRY